MKLSDIVTEQQLDELDVAGGIARGLGKVSKGIGATAGGAMGAVDAAKSGFAAGRAAVGRYKAPTAGKVNPAPASSTTADSQEKVDQILKLVGDVDPTAVSAVSAALKQNAAPTSSDAVTQATTKPDAASVASQTRIGKQAAAAQSAQAQMKANTAAPKTAASQTPDQVRAAKQKTAGATAQAQMTANPASVKAVPQTPDQVRAAKQAAAGRAAQAQMKANSTPAVQPTAPTRTGGKVAGQVSNTPNAVRKRAARSAGRAQPSAFGNMASQLTKGNAESYESTLASKIAEHTAANTVTESRSIFTK